MYAFDQNDGLSAFERFEQNAKKRILDDAMSINIGLVAKLAGVPDASKTIMPLISHLIEAGQLERGANYISDSGAAYHFSPAAYQAAQDMDGFSDPETGKWVAGSVMLAPCLSYTADFIAAAREVERACEMAA